MEVALVVNRVVPDADVNLANILRLTREAARGGAQLVLFPEAALTGLVNNDEPAHDRRLAQPIPGPATDALGEAAREHRLHLGMGLLERDGPAIYDSAVLFDPDGAIVLKYRRIHPGWHSPHAYPAVYREGHEVGMAQTPFGTCAFLICGDLFDPAVVRSLHALQPRWLLFPFARSFPDGCCDQQRWEREACPEYARQVSRLATTALMVNYVADPSLEGDGSFGGAMVVAPDGTLRASLPLGTPGILLATV